MKWGIFLRIIIFPIALSAINYNIAAYGQEGGRFRQSANLTTAAYCLAEEYNDGEESKYKYEETLFSTKEDFGVTASDLSESHIEAALNKVIAWAQAQDIE